MELEEFDYICLGRCVENVNDPKLRSILTKHLIKICIALGVDKEEILFQVGDCYDFYEEKANIMGLI